MDILDQAKVSNASLSLFLSRVYYKKAPTNTESLKQTEWIIQDKNRFLY